VQDHDGDVQNLHDEIICSARNSFVPSKSQHITPLLVEERKEKNDHSKLMLSKTMNILRELLWDFMAGDNQRQGMLEKCVFDSKLSKWYELHCGMDFLLDHNQQDLEALSCRFVVQGTDEQKNNDYVAFVGGLYTFVTEERDEIPSPKKFNKYLDHYHGTDMQHLVSIQRYIEIARIKRNEKRNMIVDREKMLNLHRSMAKIRTYQESDFLSKWVVTSLETKYSVVRKHQVAEVKRKNNVGRSDTLSSIITNDGKRHRSRKECEKTPLHLVEPCFFDSNGPKNK
jgi:hypothetical protein